MAKFLLCGLLSGVVVSHAVSAETASSRTEQGGNSYAAYIAEAAQRFGFPARWILAVMRRESAGDERAVSEKGAIPGMSCARVTVWGATRSILATTFWRAPLISVNCMTASDRRASSPPTMRDRHAMPSI